MISRKAFTVVELLVVIATIGVLVALLLPAIQSAREAARRASCQNNVKHLTLAVHAYHDARHEIPPLYTDKPNPKFTIAFGLETHSWRTIILPHIEEQSLYDTINFTQLATHNSNQTAIERVVSTFNCPSAPRTASVARGLWRGRSQFDENLMGATADYNGTTGYIEAGIASREALCGPPRTEFYWDETWTAGAWGEIKYGDTVWDPPTVRKVGFKHITDGLSRTMLVLERADLPDQHFEGGAHFEPHDPPEYRTWGNVGLWAISGCMQFNQVYHQTDKPLINQDNMLGIYSFHPGGAHISMVDGSVHFIGESVESKVILALVSREGGEATNLE